MLRVKVFTLSSRASFVCRRFARQLGRGGRSVPLKQNADEALAACPDVHSVIVVQHTGADIAWESGRDVAYQELVQGQPAEAEPEYVDAEDSLFILYTSGSTGKPKGVQHSSGGYLLHAAITHKYVFDYHDGDIYWCPLNSVRLGDWPDFGSH